MAAIFVLASLLNKPNSTITHTRNGTYFIAVFHVCMRFINWQLKCNMNDGRMEYKPLYFYGNHSNTSQSKDIGLVGKILILLCWIFTNVLQMNCSKLRDLSLTLLWSVYLIMEFTGSRQICHRWHVVWTVDQYFILEFRYNLSLLTKKLNFSAG